jgi:hypothetical protein
MRPTTILLLAALATNSIVSASAAFARSQKHTCTQEEAKRASDELDQIKGWDDVYHSFKRFARCDDGEIAEGYSDTVAKLLAKHWEDLHTLSRLTSSDRPFEKFVLRHIDETDDENDLKAISGNAALHCPPNEKHLCSLIGARVKATLVEMQK